MQAVAMEPHYGQVLDDAAKTAAEWVAEIRRYDTQATSNIIELAVLVWTAKRQLRHGDWTAICCSGELPFRQRKGQKLLVVGAGLHWTNAHDRARLPASLVTLECLARLGRTTLEFLLANGTLHPRLTAMEAKELVAKFNDVASRACKPNLLRRVRRFGDFIRRARQHFPPQDWEAARKEVALLSAEMNDDNAETTTPSLSRRPAF